MSMFSQSLIQGLINPSYAESLNAAGMLAGSLSGRQEEARKEEAEKARVAQTLSTLMNDQSPQRIRQGAASLLQTNPEAAQMLMKREGQLSSQMEQLTPIVPEGQKTANAMRARMAEAQAPRKISLAEEANLYKLFTQDSVPRFLTGKGPLVPIQDKEERTALSAHGKRLQDAGYVQGSPEFLREMELYNRNVTSGALNQTKTMTPLEQAQFLEKSLTEKPLFGVIQDRRNKIDLAESLVSGVESGRSENIKLLQRTVSELYNSDTRAASEIDRLLKNKGIVRGFADWAVSALSGDISDETKRNLMDIVEASREVANTQQKELVDETVNYYGEFVDSEVINKFKTNKLPSAGAPTIGSQDEYNALPSGTTYYYNGQQFIKGS